MKPIWNRTFNFIGRTGVALFAIILFIHGSTKNSTNETSAVEVEAIGSIMAVADEFELSARLQDSPVAEKSAAEAALLWVLVGVVTNAAAKYTMSTNAIVYRPWAVRGGFQDRLWLDFGNPLLGYSFSHLQSLPSPRSRCRHCHSENRFLIVG